MTIQRGRGSPLVAILLILIGATFLGLQSRKNLWLSLACNTNNSNQQRRAKLADGCHHVFLDVGANIGVHARFLFEPEKYPDAVRAKGWFDDAFGVDRDNRDICVFSFEPNPQHKDRLQSLARAYNAMGWRYYPIMTGVSDKDGSLDFAATPDKLQRGFSARNSVNTKQEAAKGRK